MNPDDDFTTEAHYVTAEQERSACVVLACLSLAAAEGDRQAARETLREVLEVIGAVPYQRAERRYHFGQREAS